MSHASDFPSKGFVCALALAAVAVMATPMNAQNRPDPAKTQDGFEKPNFVIQPASTPKPESTQRPASAQKPDFARYLARPDGSMPMVEDWSTRHVIYTAGYTDEQADRIARDPRAYAGFVGHGILRRPHAPILPRPISPFSPHPISLPTLKRDWAIPLGQGFVYASAAPAKYNFDVNAAPNCSSDFAVFPIYASGGTGNTRASVVGTFTADPTTGETATINITPTGGSLVALTLTAGATNTGLTFAVGGGAASDAADLAAAINRNLSAVGADELAAIASAGSPYTVTVYALTAGSQETLTVASTLTGFSWGAVTAGINGSQANIVAVNHLYAGSGSPFCSGYTFPTFTFSYAAGTGWVWTGPAISLNGLKIAFVESDNSSPSIGSILHVLTLGTGTELGGPCSNTGAALPTCATTPVIPGSTAGSNATDYMLPLQLAAGLTPTSDNSSSPFVDYSRDIVYVGDNNGYLYSVSPAFGAGTPALGGGFPVQVHFGYSLTSPVVDLGDTGNIYVGDQNGRLSSVSSTGTIEGSVAIGSSTAFGMFDAPFVDSTNGVGFATAGCNGTNSVLVQFSLVAIGNPVALAQGNLATAGCTSSLIMFAPTPDNNYFTKGISSSTADNNGEVLVAYGNATNSDLAQFQFTSGVMSTSAQYTTTDSSGFGTNLQFSPLTEFYGNDVAYTISSITQAGQTVTVTTTASNAFVSNQTVVISGVATGTGNCNSNAISNIDGEQSITVTGPNTFTFTSGAFWNIGGVNGTCTLTSAQATGPTQDYLFLGTSASAVYTFSLPLTSATQTAAATNNTSIVGPISRIIVDNDSSDGQASSIYFGNTNRSSSICGATSAYCAVKLTQSGLN